MVPGERIELSWITPHDFESCASANSAIPAMGILYPETHNDSSPGATEQATRRCSQQFCFA